MRSTAAEVQTVIEASVATALRDQAGGWNVVGQSRRVLLADGSQVQESLTAYNYPKGFAYTIKGFTGSLRLSKDRMESLVFSR